MELAPVADVASGSDDDGDGSLLAASVAIVTNCGRGRSPGLTSGVGRLTDSNGEPGGVGVRTPGMNAPAAAAIVDAV